MAEAYKILVVEDETAQRRLVAEILRQEGYQVREAPSGEAALAALGEDGADLVLCDWKMPGLQGGEVLAEVRRRGWPAAFIVMTAYGSIAHAVQAIRDGADDYLSKPFEREALLLAIRRVLRAARLEQENRELRQAISDREGFGELLGESEVMQRLFRTLRKVAATDATVLVTGESGTGKELAARAIHQASPRARGPFVALNCAAIPETLMESELFGYEKGAFTGANRRKEGKFEEADGGSLFLDEIPAMPLPLQAVLLRVLQDHRFTRLGGRGEVQCDVRIIAATNRDLNRMVAEGVFREDLFYRLNVFPVRLPPLRERREDVLLLADHFLNRVAHRYGLTVQPFPAAVRRRLLEHGWPGNVRELANAVERMALLAEDGTLCVDDLPGAPPPPSGEPGCPFLLPARGVHLDSVEAGLLRQALERASGNRAAAAKLLGLSYKTFLYRLEKHGF